MRLLEGHSPCPGLAGQRWLEQEGRATSGPLWGSPRPLCPCGDQSWSRNPLRSCHRRSHPEPEHVEEHLPQAVPGDIPRSAVSSECLCQGSSPLTSCTLPMSGSESLKNLPLLKAAIIPWVFNRFSLCSSLRDEFCVQEFQRNQETWNGLGWEGP